MKVLIADDEALVRIGIKSSIRWEAGGMDIVGEAADGEEALRLIEERKPDVVILDIKMPRKDGIQVLTEMKEKGIRAKVIILSSFDDFTMVKQAMKLGAVDYFHKPSMNEHEIEAVLYKVKEELESERQSGPEATVPGEVTGEGVLRRWLQGSTEGIERTKLREGNLYIMLFSVKKWAHVLQRYAQGPASFLPSTIRNLLTELLSKEPETEFVQLEDNLYAVILSQHEIKSVQACFTRVNDIAYLISSNLMRFVNIETVFGISDLFQSFEGGKRAAAQARQALEQKFYHPSDPVFYYRQSDEEPSLDRVNDFIVAMKNGLREERYDEFARNLNEWEQYIRSKEILNERDVKKIYEGLLFMMEDREKYLEAGGTLEFIEDFEELSVYYHDLFNKKLEAMISATNKEYSPLIRNIVQYIEANYKENISLKSLGEHFQVSANYISRLFNQEVGKGLFHFVNEIRIERAKELLKDYRYKIYEVSEMVGFNSQVHFAIVFQKYVGMAPKEYRKEHV
ncbi:response regulator [Paenibacillus filicis]|uniref:Response regulator n=1 Tax=Paenibacillus gyeongsangnamensis TaxID=3388067 RepID=A0ABT4Q746_9BACL|nr:response regulator [Paenibacillus filicis]MCZ8512656.1 response regulator [Paenibacillus filicis]